MQAGDLSHAREVRVRIARGAAIAALAAAAFVLALTRAKITGHWYGLYVLRGSGGSRLELTDDLLLGERTRVVAGMSFSRGRDIVHAGDRLLPYGPYLEVEWDEALGRGLVRNHLGDGAQLVALFSRFDNGGGDRARQGLFVGGSIPEVAEDIGRQNESGVAYRARAGPWVHIWCNANENIWDLDEGHWIETTSYEFLGSRVLVHDSRHVAIQSSHLIRIGGVPVEMERVASFTAGRKYFELSIKLQNVGERPARYMYLYGDEPWVGTFGTSAGNLGWTEDGIISGESVIDPRRHHAGGIVDSKTGVANFIGWTDDTAPEFVYISNAANRLHVGTPLKSNEIFFGLEWGGRLGRVLDPGEVQRIQLAIGMAEQNTATGRPSVPAEFPRPRVRSTEVSVEPGGSRSAP